MHIAQIREHENKTPDAHSAVMNAFELFMAAVRSGRMPVLLEWPNMAMKMARYADEKSMFNIRFGEEIVGWANSLLDKGL
ncbi:Uncharacterized protein ALO94_01450 [Pseudomonas syringae pv. spinaceae]|uniref:Uncharacterized protein n=1 Tax=Pseudomonas syringae pv. spinaceae TaxID=264459 RepID=A0A0Q0D9I5_PSESX|nr:Uncharacterized protein ALO94_01450 [Pseudomonas syringae pv. spinaceae]